MIEAARFEAELFVPSSCQEEAGAGASGLLLWFRGRGVAARRDGEGWLLPELRDHVGPLPETICCGRIGDVAVHAASADGTAEPGDWEFIDLRELFSAVSAGLVAALSRGMGLLTWLKSRRYCGDCGQALEFAAAEMARRCPSCGTVSYPVIAPAVIVAVTRGDRLLLASNHHFKPGLFSLIAGFVECGEALEDTVRREIREEVGIEVDRIRYFGSQSWPFPASLMIGFTAEYAGGELRPDGKEIIEADWFGPERLPELPSHGSISRRIIDAVLDRIAAGAK